MKLPRDLSGTALATALGRIGYRVSRQTGSHIRLTADMPSQHHVTIPAHDPLKLRFSRAGSPDHPQPEWLELEPTRRSRKTV